MRIFVLIAFLNIFLCLAAMPQQTPGLQQLVNENEGELSAQVVVESLKNSMANNEITYGNLAYFSTGTSFMTDVTVLDSNHFVAIYSEHEGEERAFAAVGMVSGTDISFGPITLINEDTTIWPRIAKLDSNKIVVSYAEGNTLSYDHKANLRIGEISGNTITFGQEHTFFDNMFWCVYHRYPVEVLHPELVVISSSNHHMPGYWTSIIGRINGDSISFSQAFPFAYSNPTSGYEPLAHTAMAIIDTNRYVVSYNIKDTAVYSASKVGTVIGDSIAFGPEYTFNTDRSQRLTTITLDSNRILNAYVDSQTIEYGMVTVGEIYGDSIAYSREFMYYDGWTTYTSATALGEYRFVVTGWDWVNNIHHGTARVGEIIGDTIIFGPFNAYSPDYCFTPQAGTISEDRFVMAFSGVWSANYPATAVIGKVHGNPFITMAGSANTCPGDISIPVLVRSMENITGFSLTLSYDTSGLEFTGIENINPILQPDTLSYAESAGQLTLYWNSASAVSIGNDTMCQIEFTAGSLYSQAMLDLAWDTISYYIDTSGKQVESHYINGYVDFVPDPEPLTFVIAPDNVCQGNQDVLYTVLPIQSADTIVWELSPPEAGILSGTGDSIYIDFSPDYLGEAYITGYGINDCGAGDETTHITHVNGEPTAEAGPGSVICQNTSYTLSGSAAYYSVSVWHTEGDGSFDDPFLLNATYTPGPEDIQNGNVYLTLYCVAIPPCTGVANDMLELIIKRVPDKPITPIGPTSIILGPNLSSDYYTHPVAYAYTYYWYLSPLEAGTINGMDTSAIVFWNEDFTGTNAFISVEAENDCATVSSDTLTVDIITVGIAESPLPVVSISPNPSSGIISISIEGIAREMNLSVLSSRGDIVHTRQINYNNPSYSFQLNLSQQASGIYYLILVWDEHKITEQFILRSK